MNPSLSEKFRLKGKGNKWMTYLMLAASLNQHQIVAKLLEAGATDEWFPNLNVNFAHNALCAAVDANALRVVEVLLDKHPPGSVEKYANLAVEKVLTQANPEMINAFKNKGAVFPEQAVVPAPVQEAVVPPPPPPAPAKAKKRMAPTLIAPLPADNTNK